MLKKPSVFTLPLLFAIQLAAAEISFGNENLTFSVADDGLVQSVTSNGEHIKGPYGSLGPLFEVTLLENVYGLDDGRRREVGLRPISQNNQLITLAPERGKLPQFTFTTIDKGSYFVLKLVSMSNPEHEHAIQLKMAKVNGTDWLPLDGVTKKTNRRGNEPHFFGVLQRSPGLPLGSIAMWAQVGDHDERLYKIWTTEAIPHPKVDGEWTVERAKQWNEDVAVNFSIL